MPVGLSPGTAPPIKSESVAISNTYPKFVNNLLAACCSRQTLLASAPISLTNRSLSRSILAGGEGKSSIHRHAFSCFAIEVSAKVEVISLGRTVRMTLRPLTFGTRG